MSKHTQSHMHEESSTLDSDTKQELINALEEKILRYQDAYYNSQPLVSDEEFDALWDRLRELDIKSSVLTRIGRDTDSFFPKTKHIMPMGSLDKAANEQEIEKWIKTHPSEFYIVQHKLDGASIELQFKEGVLVAAVTRGNGHIGDNIIVNVRKMRGVVRKIHEKRSLAIRGEIILEHHDFKKYFSDKANCRNAANGLMKRKDGVKSELLHILCYDLMFEDIADDINEELTKLELLHLWGFRVVSYSPCKDLAELNSYRAHILSMRKTLGFDIDGLVVKLPYSDRDDMASLRPDRHIAYKFPLEVAQTKIIDIEWSESGHLYTPVAILEPVLLAGTRVKRANIVHLDHMKEMGLNIGAEVLVVKRGEIIPKIEKVIVRSEKTDIECPQVCSTCNSSLTITGTRIFCPNMYCRRRLLFRIERWCEILELDNWGESILSRFVLEEKLINSIADLYTLTRDDLTKLERIGTQLADKLLQSLHAKKDIAFSEALAGLGIDGVALVTAEKIEASGIKNFEHLFEADIARLSSIDSIGPILAKNIVESSTMLKNEILALLQYIHICSSESDSGQNILNSKSFCFSGEMTLPRKELQHLVKKYGGIVKTSIVKDLDYLVTNDAKSNNSKVLKAREMGINIIDEAGFNHMIRS